MLHREPKLKEIVDEMRNLGEILVPYNYPLAKPDSIEDKLAFFKEREAIIDGYPIFLHYQKSDYESHFMKTLQVYGKNSPFLPFFVICKLAKSFLGDQYLSLVELFSDNRKIYCWSLCVDRNDQPIPTPYDMEVEQCEYEGLHYAYMQPNQVNFF